MLGTTFCHSPQSQWICQKWKMRLWTFFGLFSYLKWPFPSLFSSFWSFLGSYLIVISYFPIYLPMAGIEPGSFGTGNDCSESCVTAMGHNSLQHWSVDSVWPDLTKFLRFSKKSKVSGNFYRVYLVLRKILNQLWQFFMILGKFSLF